MVFSLQRCCLTVAVCALAAPAAAAPFAFSTGLPDGRLGSASRPASPGQVGIESADDFLLSSATSLTSATFTGLLTSGVTFSDIVSVSIGIYRVFPLDSSTPPSGSVTTRINSPADVAFAQRSSDDGGLSFAVADFGAFTALNSVRTGINPAPSSMTGGEGPVSGHEFSFMVSFAAPLLLAADHYFFVPQVRLGSGDFYWLSTARPITFGTPFAPDLQSWIRNDALAPDWLRLGTDITGQGPFNAAFTLAGDTVTAVPEPETYALLLAGLAGLPLLARARRRREVIAPSCPPC